jgi:hypothetical protein
MLNDVELAGREAKQLKERGRAERGAQGSDKLALLLNRSA